MMSVLQALVGLAGLVGSALLTLGLVSEPSRQLSPEPPAPAATVTSMVVHVSEPESPAIAEAIVSNIDRPTESWQASLAGVASGQDPNGPDVLRVCRVTAYCDQGTTASGVPSGLGQCAAPADIPFGSQVYIPALGKTFVVTDRTHRRFRRSTVDLFIPTKRQCLQFGRQFLECEFTLSKPASSAP